MKGIMEQIPAFLLSCQPFSRIGQHTLHAHTGATDHHQYQNQYRHPLIHVCIIMNSIMIVIIIIIFIIISVAILAQAKVRSLRHRNFGRKESASAVSQRAASDTEMFSSPSV